MDLAPEHGERASLVTADETIVVVARGEDQGAADLALPGATANRIAPRVPATIALARNVVNVAYRVNGALGSKSMQTIDMRSLEVKFLEDKDGTGGSLDFFELMLRPNARMPIPHYHESWDETVYGLTGISTWRVGGKDVEVGPGQCVFIKRGVVHGFTNTTPSPTTSLCILTPGVLGRSYFEEMAPLIAAGAPDPAKMKEVMLRHGLVPAPGA